MDDKDKIKEQVISELEELREKVKEIDYFKTTLRNSPIVIANQDLDLRYTWIYNTNPGFKEEKIIGKTDFEMFPEEDATKLVEIKDRVIKSGKETRETVSVTINEKKFYYDLTVVPLRNNQEEIIGVSCASTEITEIKRFEEQLRNSQLMESLGTMAGGIAHEFNNMLLPILGYIEILREKLPKEGREQYYLQEIQLAGKRASELVQQIMTFSRTDSVVLKPLDMTSVVQRAIVLTRSTMPDNITIEQDLDELSWTIMGDEIQINQIILNLCSNAAHAMRQEGGTMRITLKQLNDCMANYGQPKCLMLSVEDTGHGISKKNINKIFDPFFTTKEVGIGTGLGLSVVHGIVEKLSGKIFVESDVGQGTKFSIFIPITEVIETKTESIMKKSVKKGEGHFLVVDDEPMILYLYQEFLEDSGYTVTTCKNGLDALELFKENPPQYDVVLTDQAMPKMTGKQLSQELLKINKDLPIILSTGFSAVLSEEDAKKIGIRYYLEKPFKLDKLNKIIQECLGSVQNHA
ncbi:MAG: response regulator [Bacteroidales bacterium]